MAGAASYFNQNLEGRFYGYSWLNVGLFLIICVFIVTTAMIKIAGTKSNDKINFKEFVDFFYKVDWE